MSDQHQELREYELEDYTLKTGFSSYEDANIYASENNGELVEVAFKDGNDNPQISSEANLIADKKYFHASAGSEYRFIHSTDAEFQEFAGKIHEKDVEARTSSPEEQYFADFKLETAEDPVLVLKNGEFESITTRERAKYLKHANVYEIAVKQMK
ncbi:hypothetical protein [Frigoriflavimonas asaccharolytica]|uniref:Uncharacterized protein n=1 Tax=Frigoriflavimonas asaccharolytica TaxID=2735899 RepID=A0A8J8G6E0_9FLAO|nr:hypothetical protein [Frigoriflavimonas asaccharolytica]NRS92338.1 hypothetical protein [Frigoriflavimonas asaccharolytica]